MSKIAIFLVLHLLLLNSLFAVEKNTLHNYLENSSTSSSKGSYPLETGVSINNINITNVTSCNPNGTAKITEIAKDGVIEDISNFEITWYDPGNYVMFIGPSVQFLSAGEYFVSARHIESGVESGKVAIEIQDITIYPAVDLIIHNPNTSCDPSNPTGRIEAFIHGAFDYQNYGFTWFEGPINDHSNVLSSTTPMIDQLPAGIYTVEVVDYFTDCVTLLSINLPDEITLPQMDVRLKHNTSCMSNGELEITAITESGITQELTDYSYNLYNSDYEPIATGALLFTNLPAGTYYVSATNFSSQCISELVDVTIINDYDTSEPSSGFTVVGPNPELSRCDSGPMTLEAQGGEHLRWYDSELEGALLHEGTTYTIENLQESHSIWVSAYDPVCDLESDRKELSLKVVSLPLIASLVSDVEQATLDADVNGVIKWFLNEEVIEGKNEPTILAYKDGIYSIEVSNGDCKETKSISFNGLTFSKPENLITAPQISNSSYQWSLNGVVMEQETSHTLAVSENGVYSVKIFYENESGRFKETQTLDYTIEVTSLEIIAGLGSSFEDQNVKIYPIPFKNSITIEFSQDMGKSCTLRLWDMNGKIIIDKKMLVLKDKKITLDIPELDKGVYVLEALHSKGSYIGKITK